jgi:hypothetical protein
MAKSMPRKGIQGKVNRQGKGTFSSNMKKTVKIAKGTSAKQRSLRKVIAYGGSGVAFPMRWPYYVPSIGGCLVER